MVGEGEGSGVDDEIVKVDRSGEGHASKSAAAGEGDIDLTVGKRGAIEVDMDLVKREALGFVDGDGPSEFEGELGE